MSRGKDSVGRGGHCKKQFTAIWRPGPEARHTPTRKFDMYLSEAQIRPQYV